MRYLQSVLRRAILPLGTSKQLENKTTWPPLFAWGILLCLLLEESRHNYILVCSHTLFPSPSKAAFSKETLGKGQRVLDMMQNCQ